VSRNPHDIGRRILHEVKSNSTNVYAVAILMTLEGEYYKDGCAAPLGTSSCRNPHDIGRRILQVSLQLSLSLLWVAILMTLEGEYYFKQNSRYCNIDSRNPHDIGRRILHAPQKVIT